LVLHQKSARNKNRDLIAFRIPIELTVTLEKLGINPKEACKQFLYQIATQNNFFTASFPEKPNLSLASEIGWCGGWDLNPPHGGDISRKPPFLFLFLEAIASKLNFTYRVLLFRRLIETVMTATAIMNRIK